MNQPVPLAPFDTYSPYVARVKPDAKVADLGRVQRVWAIGALYGRYGAICAMHEALSTRLRVSDKIVYLGNYLGAYSHWTGEGAALIDEIINFRNALIATPGFLVDDVVFLRGQLEDLALGLLRLPFQSPPSRWAAAALEKGLEGYLSAYGFAVPDLITMANEGVVTSQQFAHRWKKSISNHKGHEAFYANLRSAAITQAPQPVVFVPESLDPTVPIHLQREALRRDEGSTGGLAKYGTYARLVRGAGRPLAIDNNGFVLTLDGGNGLDGMIHATCLDPQGKIIEHLTF